MFGGKQYYSLVAGLRHYTLEGDGDRKGFDAVAIRDEILGELSRAHRRTAELFYGFADIVNIVSIRAGRSQFDTLGNFSRQELEAALVPGHSGAEARENLPQWMRPVLGIWLDPDNPEYEDVDKGARFERALFEAYYAECAASGCDFLVAWSRFDRNLRNVIAAYTARGKDAPVVDGLVGSDDITLSLSRSSATDFSLKGELEYIDSLLSALGDVANVVEKERTIDMIRWDKADELSEFDSFGMPTILAYLIKVGIIHRWTMLDPATGREMYKKLLASISAEI